MNKITTIIICFVLLSLASCKKKPSAGLGGNANLKIVVIHHAVELDSCKVYIKFNSSEAVSVSEFDLSQSLQKDSAGKSYTIFKGLKKGDYYIYGEGWDPSIFNTVKGGIPFTISDEIDQTINLPVTEVH
jgi:hypothetical protein